MKVTLEMMAKELGTTKNTVSRALRGKPGVGDKLRTKITELAQQYGYKMKPDSAKNQVPVKVTMVCNSSLLNDTFFWPSIMGGVFEYAATHQISTHTVMVDMIQDDIKYILPLQDKHCDGILIVGTLPDTQFERIAKLGMPMVTIDHYSDHVECDYVNYANENGIIKAIDFLAEQGHQKIGFINNETAPYIYSLTFRYQGYLKRMEQLGLKLDSQFIWPNSSYNDNQYFHSQLDMLDSYGDRPTAWICANDLTAYNFCSVLKERGICIPDDVSVVGFDNIPGVFHTPLTTLEIPKNAIGQRALHRLMSRLKNPEEPFESIEIFTRLIVRESVKKIG